MQTNNDNYNGDDDNDDDDDDEDEDDGLAGVSTFSFFHQLLTFEAAIMGSLLTSNKTLIVTWVKS